MFNYFRNKSLEKLPCSLSRTLELNNEAQLRKCWPCLFLSTPALKPQSPWTVPVNRVAEEMGGKNRAFFSLILEFGRTFLGSAYYIRLSEWIYIYIYNIYYEIYYVSESCSVVSLCNPTDCSPPGSSVHVIFWARITGLGSHSLLQGGLPHPGTEPWSPVLLADSFPSEPPGKKQSVAYISPWYANCSPRLVTQAYGGAGPYRNFTRICLRFYCCCFPLLTHLLNLKVQV